MKSPINKESKNRWRLRPAAVSELPADRDR